MQKKLGAKFGLPWLYLKNETKAPTGTTKDRMAAVSLAYLYESGVRVFCTSSTGNSSTAYANFISNFPDFSMCLFTAEAFKDRVQYTPGKQIKHFVLRDASFVEAFNYSSVFARKNGFTTERGFFNLGRREGLKLAWFEASEQISRPLDWYVQAISSAMGVYGTYKGAKELQELNHTDRLPHLLCVQQESCSPMASAWREGSETIQPHHIIHNPSGIAKAILRGDPTRAYPLTRKIVIESDGDIESVSEQEIRDAQAMVKELEGISICFSASTAIAGLIKQVRNGNFPCHETVLVNLTGSDRATDDTNQDDNIHWLSRSGDGWKPDDPDKEGNLVF